MSRPEAGSLIAPSAARNASVDGVAISLLTPCRSIKGHHLMCLDQIWRMMSGTPMVRRPAGEPNSKCPGKIMARTRGAAQVAAKGAARRVVAVKEGVVAMVMASRHTARGALAVTSRAGTAAGGADPGQV